jgi:S1-C subfamily serine protease
MKFVVATIGALLIMAMPGFSYAADAKSEAEIKAERERLEDAHKRLEQAARDVAELSAKLSNDRMPDRMIFLGRNPNRAVLGIGIGGSNEAESNEGVAVQSVSPGGPAANAGIKAGDVIVELNGKSLKREKSANNDQSPREKLLDGMSKLSPGDEVTVKYLREGKPSIAKLKADRLPEEFAHRGEIYRMRTIPGDMPRFDKDDFNFNFEAPNGFPGMMHGGSFGDIEMAPLTPKLAQYFGTEKGLLIVRAPQSKELKLEDGDVLIDIDGRVPSNPGHAYRILGSYQTGEKLTLNIFRQRKKVAVAITVPEHEEHGRRVIRERIERVPVKPAVPAPAAPTAAPPAV